MLGGKGRGEGPLTGEVSLSKITIADYAGKPAHPGEVNDSVAVARSRSCSQSLCPSVCGRIAVLEATE